MTTTTTNTGNTKARRSSWKRCPHCHRNLRTTDYYRDKDGGLASWCKQCQRQAKREWYATRRKRPAPTVLHPATRALRAAMEAYAGADGKFDHRAPNVQAALKVVKIRLDHIEFSIF